MSRYKRVLRIVPLIIIAAVGFVGGHLLHMSLSSQSEDIDTFEESDKNKTVFKMDSEKEWSSQSGRFWTKEATSISDGKFRVVKYNKWRNKGYRSTAAYKSYMKNLTSSPRRLDEISWKGYLGNTKKTALRVQIKECAGDPLTPSEQQEYCYSNKSKVLYDSGPVNGTGNIEITENLSDIVADRYIRLYMEVLVNTTERLPAEEEPYIDAVRLKAES